MPELAQAEQTLTNLLTAHGGRAYYTSILKHAAYRHPLTVVDAAFWNLVREGHVERLPNGECELKQN